MVEDLLALLSFIMIGAGVVSPTLDYTVFGGRRCVSPWVALVALLLSCGVLAYGGYVTIGEPAEPVFGGMMKVGFFEVFLSLMATIGGLLVTVASLKEVRTWSTSPSFYSLLLLAVLGAYYLIGVRDFVLFIGAWALVSVISYVLVGVRKDRESIEGAVKYSVMGILASVLLLYAIAVAYSLTGSTNVDLLTTIGPGGRSLALLASVLFVAAFGFKLGIVPFHGWLPDVYGRVHPMLVAFLAGVVAVTTGAILIRILYPLAPIVGSLWPVLIGLLSLFTMTFGNVVALLQKNLQRMMAFSSIAQMGYLLIGLAAAESSGEALGLQGMGLHLTSYMIAKVGIFVFLAYLVRKGISLELEDLKGLSRRSPILTGAVLLVILNLLGVPPLLGFWSKFFLFASVIGVAPWLAFAAIINSGISVGYYVQPIRYMFSGDPSATEDESLREPDAAVVLIAALLTLAAGLLLPSIAPHLVI
jgi:NADH-quinone oxidoreductase subunit N